MESLSLEERLDAVHRSLEDALIGGHRPNTRACMKALDMCMSDVKQLLLEPMHTDLEWVAGLNNIKEQMKLLMRILDRFLDCGGSQYGQIAGLRSTVEVMLDRITSLQNERKRVRKARQLERIKGEKKNESTRERRFRYERELYQYSLLDSPGKWKTRRTKKGQMSLDKLSKTILALLPPPDSMEDSMALTIPGMDAELAKTPLAKMQEKEEIASTLRAEGKLQEEVAVRQDLIALARLHCQFDDGLVDATALARAHINLGGAYAAIEFWKQAAIHGRRGLQQLEKLPLSTPGYIPIERGGHALLGEALMNTQPPKPELAMEHLSKGYPDDSVGDMPAVLALKLSECHAKMGEDAAEKALDASREAKAGLADIRKAESRLSGMDQADRKRIALQDRLFSLRPRIAQIERDLPEVCHAAEGHLDKAIDALMDYIDRYERALEKQGIEPDRNSEELKGLYRRCSELMLTLAELKQAQEVFSRAGATMQGLKDALGLLDEIIRLQRVYGNIESDLLASTYLHRGNVCFKSNRSDEALESYQELLTIQQSRGGDYKTAEAEAHKLIGNVYVGLQDMSSALRHYEDAFMLFRDAGSHQAAEMQKRLDSLVAYTSAAERLHDPLEA